MRSVVHLGAIVLLELALASAARAQGCPRDTIALYATNPVEFAGAAGDTALGSRTASYDLRIGKLSISHPGTVGSMSLACSDLYRVTGLPDGTPVSIAALFDIDGFAETSGCGGTGCFGQFGASMSDGQTYVERSVTAYFAAGHFPLVETISIPLQVVAGQDFDLRMTLWFIRAPGASHWGGGSGHVRFGNLPAGAAVVSCQGYDSAVPVRRSTWGRVKALYR